MRSNSQVNFLVDTMIVQTILTNNLSKTAGLSEILSSLTGPLVSYVGQHINESDKLGSVINMLAPGVITVGFSALGMPWIGTLVAIATKSFGIDVGGIVSSIWKNLTGKIGGDKKTTSEEVDSAVQSAVQEHAGSTDEAKVDDKISVNFKKSLQQARMIKLAMIEFDAFNLQTYQLRSNAGLFTKGGVASILGAVLRWIFKVVLASAGFMVAGDVINKALGRPNGFDGTKKQETITTTAPVTHASTQTKFKVQPTYRETPRSGNWVLNIPNNASSIDNMLLLFAKKVYQGLDGLEDIITNTAGFQVIGDEITEYNQSSAGDNFVYIPKKFNSEKNIVDYFIDDVAEKAP